MAEQQRLADLDAQIDEARAILAGAASAEDRSALIQMLTALQQQRAALLVGTAGAAGGGTAAQAAGRGSDDASAKAPGGSPKLTKTSVTTVALADKAVTLGQRFPGIEHTERAVTPVLAPEAWEFVSRALLQPALSMLAVSQLSTEAARVHIAGLMLLEAVILFPKPQQEQALVLSSGDSQADSLSISEQPDKPAQLGFEQHVRAGSFKGRVELQVVRKTQQGDKLFAGAVEVKQAGHLEDHVEQAKKEAFAMWCHNAVHGKYDPVWVVLTDLNQVLRVTYEGHNCPGGRGQLYRRSMSCDDVRGTMRLTDAFALGLMMSGGQPTAHKCEWKSAVMCFIGGLLGQEPVTLEVLQERLQAHKTRIQRRVDELMPSLPLPVADQQPFKRAKVEE